MKVTARRSRSRALAMAAACLAVGGALSVPVARAEPVGQVEHLPTRCEVGTLASGPEGNVWFSCFREGIGLHGQALVGRVTPQGRVREFSAEIPADLRIADLVAGADGNLWFTLETGIGVPTRGEPRSAIGRMTPAGDVTLFRAGLQGKSAPGEIVAAPDGDLWFLDRTEPPEIGRVTPAGTITEFATGVQPPLGPGGLATGADGDVWFTQVFDLPHGDDVPGGLVGRLSPDGTVAGFGSDPPALGAPVLGPDGNVWFTAGSDGEAIDRVTPSGQISSFGAGLKDGPTHLVAGPDGNVWFTARRSVGRVTPSGQITSFTDCMHYRQPFSEAFSIVAGPDQDLWFTSITSRELPAIEEPPTIGRVTPSGQITQFKAGIGSEPRSILAGPDGRVWFAGAAEEIERITPPSAPVNTFVFTRGRASAGGAAKLAVEVPGPGRIRLRPLAVVLPHKRTVKVPGGPVVRATAPRCGPTPLRLRLRGAAEARLRRDDWVRLQVKATFTPTGGSANTEVRPIVLTKRRAR
ncbi:MAG TPA: hypothetical protein VHE08_07125 [Solirubrobacterales bacterium]|nr:hypothetical protein [Solirubrobacterales bacterium]